jgi:hypothetical protein
MGIRDPGWRRFGSGMEKKSEPGSGKNISSPQHWFLKFLFMEINVNVQWKSNKHKYLV